MTTNVETINMNFIQAIYRIPEHIKKIYRIEKYENKLIRNKWSNIFNKTYIFF